MFSYTFVSKAVQYEYSVVEYICCTLYRAKEVVEWWVIVVWHYKEVRMNSVISAPYLIQGRYSLSVHIITINTTLWPSEVTADMFFLQPFLLSLSWHISHLNTPNWHHIIFKIICQLFSLHDGLSVFIYCFLQWQKCCSLSWLVTLVFDKTLRMIYKRKIDKQTFKIYLNNKSLTQSQTLITECDTAAFNRRSV